MMRKLGGIILLTVVQFAEADPQLLQGRIGRAAVVVELNVAQNGQVSGRYFNRKRHHDITLSGSRQPDGSLQLGEDLQDDGQRNKITLRPKSGSWIGVWQDSKGNKAATVSLRPYLQGKWPASKRMELKSIRQHSGYDYIRLAGLSLKPGKRERVQGHTLQWWDEPVSKIRMFRVLDGYPEASLQGINQVLAERQWREVANYFQCLELQQTRSEYSLRATPMLISPSLLSVSLYVSFDCYADGPRPGFGDFPLNIALPAVQTLELNDLLAIAPDPQSQYVDTSSSCDVKIDTKDAVLSGHEASKPDDDPEERQAAWLARTMSLLYPDQVRPTSNADGCDYRDASDWSIRTWYATPQGLYLGPSFPMASRACELPTWSVLPWSLVKQHPGARPDLLP